MEIQAAVLGQATRTVAASFESGICVVAYGRSAPAAPDFAAMLDAIRQALQWAGGDASRFVGVIFSDGGAPTAAQRNQLKELFGGKDNTAVAILCADNKFAQGVATIVSWFIPSLKLFGPEAWRQAFDYARVPAERRKEVLATALRLAESVAADNSARALRRMSLE